MAEIFKAYDIRGIVPNDLNKEIVYKIGRAFVTFLKCDKVVIGRDMRESSNEFFKALSKGITEQGADVIDIGLSSTPMLYFAAQGYSAAIMITASHNPKEYNGFKLCTKDAIPISGDTGIMDIKDLVQKNEFKESGKKGAITKKDVMEEFIKHNLKFAKDKEKIKELRFVIDTANAMGGFTHPKVYDKLNLNYVHLFPELDHNFPNHEANPLKFETLSSLQEKVKKEKADFGIAIDGDADRCAFIDEQGNIIPMDLTTALIAGILLKDNPDSKVLHDLRSSWAVKESIQKNSGTPIMCRVGHAFIKQQMRNEDAIFAGELSGHYYYKQSFFTESTIISCLLIMKLLAETRKPLSELVKPLRKYFQSGEINSEVEDKDEIINKLKQKYCDGKLLTLDGISIEYKDWWFNVRPSNTEPVLRLNLEAKSKELMERKRDEVLEVIRSC